MKKILLVGALLFLPLQIASATVGGPSGFDNFYHLTDTNEIWFTHSHANGLGCTDLKKYSLESHKLTTEVDCTGNNYEQAYEDIETHLQEFEKTGIPLQEIDLEKINIRFETTFESGNFFDENGKVITQIDSMPLTDPYFWYIFQHINWQVIPFINDTPQTSFVIPTCIREKPINFTGIGSPSHDFLAIIVTSISLCDEFEYPNDHFRLLENIHIPQDAFKGKPTPGYIFDEKKLRDLIIPMPGKIFHQPNFQPIATYLNTVGFQAYQEEAYEIATHFFQLAYSENYLLPLFNLAATEAKIGKIDQAFEHLEELFSYPSTRDYYLQKIAADADFDKLRNDKRYLTYFPDYIITENSPTEVEKIEKIEKTEESSIISTPPQENADIIEEEEEEEEEEEAIASTESAPFSSSSMTVYIAIFGITFLFGILFAKVAKKKK